MPRQAAKEETKRLKEERQAALVAEQSSAALRAEEEHAQVSGPRQQRLLSSAKISWFRHHVFPMIFRATNTLLGRSTTVSLSHGQGEQRTSSSCATECSTKRCSVWNPWFCHHVAAFDSPGPDSLD